MSLSREDVEAKFYHTPVIFLPCDHRTPLATMAHTSPVPLPDVLPYDPLKGEYVVIVVAKPAGGDAEEFEVWGYHRVVPLLLQCKGWVSGAPMFPSVRRKDCTEERTPSTYSLHHDLLTPITSQLNLDDLEKALALRFQQYKNPTAECLTLPPQTYVLAAATVHYTASKLRKEKLLQRFLKGEEAIHRYRLSHCMIQDTDHFRVDFIDSGLVELLYMCKHRSNHTMLSRGVITCRSLAMRCWFELANSKQLHEQAVRLPRPALLAHPHVRRMMKHFADGLYIGYLKHYRTPSAVMVVQSPIPDLEDLHKLMPACMKEMSKAAFHPKRAIPELRQPEVRLRYEDRLIFNAYILGNGVKPDQLIEAMVSVSHRDQSSKHKMASQIKRIHKELSKKYVDYTSCNKMAAQGRCPYVAGGHSFESALQCCYADQSSRVEFAPNTEPKFYSPISFTQKLKARIKLFNHATAAAAVAVTPVASVPIHRWPSPPQASAASAAATPVVKRETEDDAPLIQRHFRTGGAQKKGFVSAFAPTTFKRKTFD